MWHATTSCGIMNDAVFDARVHTQDERARISERRRNAMLHLIHYPKCAASEYCHKQSVPLPFNWNTSKFILASQS